MIKNHKVDVLTILLLSIIFIIGTINFYYSRHIGKKYATLLEQSIRASKASSNIMRNSYTSLLNLEDLIYNSPEKGSNVIKELRQRKHRNEAYFKTLDSIADIFSKKEEFNKLQQARLTYRASRDSLITLIEKGDIAITRNYFLNTVKPNMDDYQKEQIVFIEQVRSSTLKGSDAITELTRNVNRATIILAILPIVSMLLIFFVILRLLVKIENTWQQMN